MGDLNFNFLSCLTPWTPLQKTAGSRLSSGWLKGEKVTSLERGVLIKEGSAPLLDAPLGGRLVIMKSFIRQGVSGGVLLAGDIRNRKTFQ